MLQNEDQIGIPSLMEGAKSDENSEGQELIDSWLQAPMSEKHMVEC